MVGVGRMMNNTMNNTNITNSGGGSVNTNAMREGGKTENSSSSSSTNQQLFGEDLPTFGSGLSNDAVVIDSIHHSPTHYLKFSDAEYKALFRSEDGGLIMPASEQNTTPGSTGTANPGSTPLHAANASPTKNHR